MGLPWRGTWGLMFVGWAAACGPSMSPSGSSGGSGSVSYSAHWLPADIPQIRVLQTDPLGGRCIALNLVGYAGSTYPGIKRPANCWISAITLLPHAADCQTIGLDVSPPTTGLFPTSATGSLRFEGNTGVPTALSFDISAVFTIGLDNLTVAFTATDIPIQAN